MTDDLKDYRAPLGAFQLLTPDAAVFAICCIVALLAIFWPYVI